MNRARVRVWCEDGEQELFIRQLLQEVFRIERRDVRVTKAPDDKGDASSWVASRYRAEVMPDCRKARHQKRLGFLVTIDGDNVGFKRRLAELEAAPRDPADRLALLVPTWSIETWVLWLLGEEVTESVTLKDRLKPPEFRKRLPDAIKAWRIERAQEATIMPSLSAARVELKRLPLS